MEKECCFCKSKMKKIALGREYCYYRCSRCHWYSTAIKNGKNDAFDYDGYETFDAKTELYEEYVAMAERILRYKFNLIGRVPNSFLDIGCSEGPYVEAFNRISGSNKGVGVETSISKVEKARQRGLNVLPAGQVPQKKYGFVYMRHVVEHICNPWDFIDLYSNYVSNQGILCIETPNSEDIKDVFINRNHIKEDRYLRDLYPPTHVCGYATKTFSAIFYKLKKKGFSNMKIMTYDSANRNWMFDSDISMNPLRYMTEKLKCAQNIACFFVKK